MKKTDSLFTYIAWTVLAAYLLLGVLYGAYMSSLFHAQARYEANPTRDSFPPLWCGNAVTDPLVSLLNLGTPLAATSLAWLIFTSRRTSGPAFRIVLAFLGFLLPTSGLVSFAIWFFHGPPLEGTFRIADQVWWLFGI